MKTLTKIIILLSFILMPLKSVFSQIIIGANKWNTGQTLKVLFMNGGEEEKRLFTIAVENWAQYVNLDFEFHDYPENHFIFPLEFRKDTIRVKFNRNEGNFSHLGMNFNMNLTDSEKYLNINVESKRKIKFLSKSYHEFGHALALMHEHRHPQMNKNRSDEELKSFCQKALMINPENSIKMAICIRNLRGVTQEEITKYDMDLEDFDTDSVMLYDVFPDSPNYFFTMSLSLKDKLFIAKHYPFEKPLTEKEIIEMHKSDQKKELDFLVNEYKDDVCFFTIENAKVYLTKNRADSFRKHQVPDMSYVDHYFQACIK